MEEKASNLEDIGGKESLLKVHVGWTVIKNIEYLQYVSVFNLHSKYVPGVERYLSTDLPLQQTILITYLGRYMTHPHPLPPSSPHNHDAEDPRRTSPSSSGMCRR